MEISRCYSPTLALQPAQLGNKHDEVFSDINMYEIYEPRISLDLALPTLTEQKGICVE